jgi:uncharacterized membrane protein YccC
VEDLDPRLAAIIAVIAMVPVFALSYYLFGENRAYGIVTITIVCSGVVYARDDIYKKRFFILSISIIYVIQILILFLIKLPTRWQSYYLVPIGIADGTLVYYLIVFIEKMVGSRSGSREGQG